LEKKNPDSHVGFDVDETNPNQPQVFRRLFMSFGVIVEGFWKGCRQFIGIDGCCLKNGISGAP